MKWWQLRSEGAGDRFHMAHPGLLAHVLAVRQEVAFGICSPRGHPSLSLSSPAWKHMQFVGRVPASFSAHLHCRHLQFTFQLLYLLCPAPWIDSLVVLWQKHLHSLKLITLLMPAMTSEPTLNLSAILATITSDSLIKQQLIFIHHIPRSVFTVR